MNFIPRSLFWRFLLIIILPILLLQVVITIIFYQRHWDNVTTHMQYDLIGEIQSVLSIIQDYPINYNMLKSIKPLNLQTKILTSQECNTLEKHFSSIHKNSDLLDFQSRLQVAIPSLKFIYYANNYSSIVGIFKLDQKYVQITFSSKRIKSPTTYIFMIWMLVTSFLLIIISVAFMRNQVKSIVKLAEVANSFGKGRDIEFFQPSGAKEIRVAGTAFLKMKQRIERQIKYRTELLAHISHDLRTPLTRLKLQSEMLEDKTSANEIIQDLNEMEQMVKSYLNFAKAEGNEEVQKLDIIKLIQDTVSKFSDNRISLSLETGEQMLHLRPHALQRALNNLIENAIKYAHSKIDLRVYKKEDSLQIIIDDDGQGVPEQYRKLVFKPFHKISNRQEGYGLGLAIAKSIVQAHGGKIKLEQSPYSGLRVILTFPI